jgi:hypothetical protein
VGVAAVVPIAVSAQESRLPTPTIEVIGRSAAPVLESSVTLLEVKQVRSADLDGDGLVGEADRDALLDRWGTADRDADLNDDGVVDGFDLGLLLGGWNP